MLGAGSKLCWNICQIGIEYCFRYFDPIFYVCFGRLNTGVEHILLSQPNIIFVFMDNGIIIKKLNFFHYIKK